MENENKRKKILVIAAWYPSEENPYAGSFFKEQCELLAEKFNVTVIAKRIRTKKIISHSKITLIHDSSFFHEYNFYVMRKSLVSLFLDKLYGAYRRRNNKIEAINSYDSPMTIRLYNRQAKNIINKIGTNYDIVYGISAQGVAPQAMILAKNLGIPLVFGEHQPFPWPGSTINDSTKEALESADCFFAISNDKIRQIMLQNIRLKKICYVGNFIDEKKFFPSEEKHNQKTLLIVAAHSFFKNYTMFIDTMNKLKKIADKPFTVIIAGYAANKGYSKNADTLEKRIKNSIFADNSILIPEVNRKDMPSLYRKADAFIMTSIQEGQPVSALEAACSGLPIFSTRCGGVEDYVDETIGRIVNITDSDSMAGYLNDFINEKITFNKDVIRNKIVSIMGRDSYLKKITDEFNSLIKNQKDELSAH